MCLATLPCFILPSSGPDHLCPRATRQSGTEPQSHPTPSASSRQEEAGLALGGAEELKVGVTRAKSSLVVLFSQANGMPQPCKSWASQGTQLKALWRESGPSKSTLVGLGSRFMQLGLVRERQPNKVLGTGHHSHSQLRREELKTRPLVDFLPLGELGS